MAQMKKHRHRPADDMLGRSVMLPDGSVGQIWSEAPGRRAFWVADGVRFLLMDEHDFRTIPLGERAA